MKALQHIPFLAEIAPLEDQTDAIGYGDGRDQRTHHGQCAERKELTFLFVVKRVMNEGREADCLLATAEAEKEADDEPGDEAVGVRLGHVNDADQLRKEEDEHEVGTENEEGVDGAECQG